jgi:ABC-2 type transport system permease protein
MKTSNRKDIKKQNLIQFSLLIIIVVFINIIGNYLFIRIDLTTEKRYTLSSNTKQIISNLNDIIYFRVFLDGDLPAQYKKLRNETKIMLDEFRSYNKQNIQYEFIDITKGKDRKQIHDILQDFRRRGIHPIIDRQGSETEVSERIIIPSAIATYGEREMPVQLLVHILGSQAMSTEFIVNNSIQALEFKFADAIRKLTVIHKPKIGILTEYSSLRAVQLAEAQRALSEYYNVEMIRLDEKVHALKGFQGIIIAKPDSTFSEKNKFIIDQFIMKGGKVLWLIDAVNAEMDSLRNISHAIAISKKLNLEDMLFKYGARVNTDLLLDINAIPIPIVTGTQGEQPKIELYTWPYFPMIFTQNLHPIVHNLNPIRTEFVNSIDTVGGKGITKSILLTTSRFSRKINTPATINLELLYQQPERTLYNKAHVPIAVLLEGEFESVFLNRLPTEIVESPEINYFEKSIPNKMIIVSDGDIIKNQFIWNEGKYMTYPLGFDRYTNTTYGNNDFLLNAMSYLCDENNLLDIRSRELKIRLLDKDIIQKDRFKWQFVNMVMPIVLIFLIGLIFIYYKKKYFVSFYSNQS